MAYTFTKAIFWDVNESEINYDKHRSYIIGRVLNYGTLTDWKELKKMFSEKTIISEAVKIKDLHPKTLSFLSAYFNLPKTDFRCYTETQSSPVHYPC